MNTSPDDYLYADYMDERLHRARIDGGRRKVTYEAPLRSLPDAAFVEIGGASYLVWGEVLTRWSAQGYTERMARPETMSVRVLTPEPIVECLRSGYRPEVHESCAYLSNGFSPSGSG